MPTKFDRALGILNPKPVNEGFEKPQILTNDNISGVNSNNNEDVSAGEKSIRNETSDFVLYNKEKPDAGVYEYIYDKTTPRVPEPDPAKEKKTQRMAGFADLAMLLSDGITATAGGIVNKRNTTATGVNNRSAEAIRERYRQQKEKYDAGMLAAKYNDLQDKRKREDYLEKLRQDKIAREEKLRLDKIIREEKYQHDRDLIKEREKSNINLYSEQSKMRKDLEKTKGDVRIGVAAAKPATDKTSKESTMYDQYNTLQSLYQEQVRKYEEAKKKDKKASYSQYVTIQQPVATTKAEIEAYVGINRKHLKPILDQMEAEAKAKAEAKSSPKTDRLELGFENDNTNNPLGF